MYIENHGEMSFTNIKNSDTGVLKLKKRSWTSKVNIIFNLYYL